MAKKKNKDKLKDRKNKTKTHKFYRKYVDRHPTISGLITAIYCKGCGTQIKGLNKEGSLIPFWNYREITIEFDNNTAHETPMCRKCANVQDKDALEALYLADLDDFEVDDTPKDNDIWNLYLDRVPKKNKIKEDV